MTVQINATIPTFLIVSIFPSSGIAPGFSISSFKLYGLQSPTKKRKRPLFTLQFDNNKSTGSVPLFPYSQQRSAFSHQKLALPGTELT